MNEQLKQDLLENIASMLDKHRLLLQLVEKQSNALIHHDHDALQTLLPQCEQVSDAIIEIENHRIGITNLIADQLGLDPKEATSEAFVSAFGGDDGLRLDELSKQLQEVVQQLARVNERNALLTKFSIDYTQKILELVTGAEKNETYGPGKRINPGARILNLEA